MQTFMPYRSHFLCARKLDHKRLNKQILEARQIINIIESKTVRGAYINNPAVIMWRDNVECLKTYFNACLREWVNTRRRKHSYMPYKTKPHNSPLWEIHNAIFESHRSMLFQKDPVHYKEFADTKHYDKYLWPSDIYPTYYKIAYDFEFDFGISEDYAYYPERYTTRKEAIDVCQRNLLEGYGHYYVDGNSRFAIDTPVQLEPLFVRLQPICFIGEYDNA